MTCRLDTDDIEAFKQGVSFMDDTLSRTGRKTSGLGRGEQDATTRQMAGRAAAQGAIERCHLKSARMGGGVGHVYEVNLGGQRRRCDLRQ